MKQIVSEIPMKILIYSAYDCMDVVTIDGVTSNPVLMALNNHILSLMYIDNELNAMRCRFQFAAEKNRLSY